MRLLLFVLLAITTAKTSKLPQSERGSYWWYNVNRNPIQRIKSEPIETGIESYYNEKNKFINEVGESVDYSDEDTVQGLVKFMEEGEMFELLADESKGNDRPDDTFGKDIFNVFDGFMKPSINTPMKDAEEIEIEETTEGSGINPSLPTDGPSGSGPTDDPSGSGPTDGPSGSGPTDDPSGSGPTDGPSGSGPTDGPSGSGPTDDPSGSGPTDGPSGSGPTDTTTTDTTTTDTTTTDSTTTDTTTTDSTITSSTQTEETTKFVSTTEFFVSTTEGSSATNSHQFNFISLTVSIILGYCLF